MSTKKDLSNLPASKKAKAELENAVRHAHYTFPTLTIRQAHILLECMKLGLDKGVTADGKIVSGDEWIELTKTLINVR